MSHWLLVFLAFVLLLFATQFLFYLGLQLKNAESKAQVHLLVASKNPRGFKAWRESLGLVSWKYHRLKDWGQHHESFWKGIFKAKVNPLDLFSGRVSGVWVAQLPPFELTRLLEDKRQWEQTQLVQHRNVVNVLGYPRWQKSVTTWFWTWAVICLAMILIASAMLLSAVMADVSLSMVSQRREMEIKHWLGATLQQLRYPFVKSVLLRSLTIILFAACLNIVCYLFLVAYEFVEVSWDWLQMFSLISFAAILLGIYVVWFSSRTTFKRMISQWVP